MTMRLRRRTAVAALSAMLLLAAPVTTAQALSAPASAPAAPAAVTSRLPSPTGPYAVGTEVLHLTDHARTDPWVPAAGDRELMVSLYYPARTGRAGSTAPYMSTEEARLVLAGAGLEGTVPPATLSSLGTHARTGARTAPGRFPLVLLSPGFGNPRATVTSLAEDLASRGYVVASVDHAYESAGTELPDGRLLTCVACERLESAPTEEAREELGRLVSTGRAADLSFVLDRLTGHRPAWKNSRMVDRRRVAVTGHSIGGSAAASAMLADPRFDAGINMDGTFMERIPASGLGRRPFMMLGSAPHSPGGGDTSWDQGWQRLDGWKRWIRVEGSGHSSFTDVPVLEDLMGVTLDPTVTLSTDRQVRITRDYVGAFLDQHLRGRHQPLLDGPTQGNPEVVFHRP
ncbi:alpha/beta hydrolase [Streptomyces sp. B1I3]|uniref:alpha/beta hydrolase family protein n=1 Tax=Streptomyces sp. B1I3 TaxID=3042264 RepID=UPI002789968E|nr:alpha/beta hydrolase [Streptomyces sp. B1I3]MDQ0795803.1 putative dienelactone hydrolase [Streptomyces sp. B1I3]